MADATGTSWADIPLDLAGRILHRLPAHVDRVRFAAVCPQWRAATRQEALPPSPPLPLLLLSDATAYSLPGTEPFRFPVSTGYTDACGDWLVFSREDGCFLRNPFSNATVTLPPLSRVRARLVGKGGGAVWTQAPPNGSATFKRRPKHTITFSHRGRMEGGDFKAEDDLGHHLILEPPRHVGDESVDMATRAWMEMAERLQLEEEPKKFKVWLCSPDFIVATVKFTGCERIAVCQAGAISWWSVYMGNDCPDIIDMAFHQGELYALDVRDTLFAIDVSTDHISGAPWISQIRKVIDSPCLDMPWFLLGLKRAYLVESHGVLLVVLRMWGHPLINLNLLYKICAAEFNEFEVFEADLRQSKWLKMTMIGNNEVLFLRRRSSRSVCISHNALPGDCIFFLDNDDKDYGGYGASCSCGVYSMTDDKVSNPLPTVSWKSGMVFGTWFFPQN